MANNPFSGFIAFGRKVMGQIEQDDPVAIRYKWLLGEINVLFGVTHSLVTGKLEQVESAKSFDEAADIIESLRSEALSNTFHAQGLCDAFVGLGRAFGELNLRIQSVDSNESLLDLGEARHIAEALENREFEVARLYSDAIASLTDLVNGTSDDLGEIKKQAEEARNELTNQTADFKSLAQDFRTISV